MFLVQLVLFIAIRLEAMTVCSYHGNYQKGKWNLTLALGLTLHLALSLSLSLALALALHMTLHPAP